MRDWLSAKDLAALALPGLPATERGWRDHAEREGWIASGKARARAGRGGGLEFHIDLLPATALAAYVSQNIGAATLRPEDAAAAGIAEEPAPLTLLAQESRDARLVVLAACERFSRDTMRTRKRGDATFCALYNMGKIEVEPWVRAHVTTLSTQSLTRWRGLKRAVGISRLGVDKGAARRGKGKIESGADGRVYAFLRAAIVKNRHFSAEHLQGLLRAEFPGAADVSKRTIQRVRKKIEEQDKVLITAVRNPDAFKSKYRMSGQHPRAARLNELWQIDASPVDALCVDGRHSVYLCIDSFSRRLSVYVSRTPRAEAVALLMRRAILAWGVPERVKTDNGSDFKAKTTQRLFAALDIEVELSAPFSPEQKGMVERAVRTFQHDLPVLMSGFIGHNVKDRKEIEERRAFSQRLGLDDAGAFRAEMTGAELQKLCDDWAITYAGRAHSALKGATPFQMAASFSGQVRRIQDVRALDLLLAAIPGGDGTRIVTKRGVRIDHSYYLAPTVLPETRVFIRMDPEDMGRAWLFSEDGAEFLGEAICPELAGIDPAAALAEARARQKQLMEDGLKQLRREQSHPSLRPCNVLDTLVRQPAIAAGKLVEFPKPAESYTSPGLQAARAAIDETVAPFDAAFKQALQPVSAVSNENAAPVVRLPETKAQRFRRARELEAMLANNERIANEEALWLGGYQASAEYKSMATMFEEFGEEGLG